MKERTRVVAEPRNSVPPPITPPTSMANPTMRQLTGRMMRTKAAGSPISDRKKPVKYINSVGDSHIYKDANND